MTETKADPLGSPGFSVPSTGTKVIKLDPQIVGNVGLYYCCYKLSLLGWNVMPTARNARGVDLIAYTADASRFIGVQVKALSKRNPVPLGGDLEKCMGDFWVIINRVAASPTAFVLRPSEVRERAHRGEKDGRISYWLQPIEYEQERFREAWARIGHGGIGNPTIDPSASHTVALESTNLPPHETGDAPSNRRDLI